MDYSGSFDLNMFLLVFVCSIYLAPLDCPNSHIYCHEWGPGQVLSIRWTDRLGKGIRTAPRDALLNDSVRSDQRGGTRLRVRFFASM